jgi:hypothetical protein
MTKAEEAQHAEALHGLMLSTTATNKAIAMLAEVQMARLAHPDIPRSEKSPIDRLWAAAPVVLICATMLISTNSRFLTGESSLDKRVGFIERDEIDHKERERIRERDIKLLDSYNRDLVNFLRERGIKNAPAPPTLGKEDR